ncbi:Lrp/AsnC family transcriptional regulator [Chitinophaga sp.]|uniref:Lrp/AsnC family transcriptional regulator n=1 Tax=Chitinophaga sp. TaxID=1869181 RepID=UPI0026033D68|nr:Lrp/AsnC family transcriptional regulator [uncultured Chitinophaga sp.]
MTLDETDKKILRILQQNAKLSHKQIGDAVNRSATPVYERIRKMEEAGVVKGYVALVDHKKVGRSLVVFTAVHLDRHEHEVIKAFEKEIVHAEEVMECYHMTGTDDYLLKVAVRDMDEYQQFIVEKLSRLRNIGTVRSSFVMTEIKHETAFKV